MDLDTVLREVLGIAGTFNFKIAILLLVICAIGEFGIAIPFLLETVWLLSGYHAGTGELAPFDLLLLWLMALTGRELGTLIFYYFAQLGRMPLVGFYRQRLKVTPSQKLTDGNSLPVRLIHRLGDLSPFAVAMGRLLWLRIPLTLTMAMHRRLKTLLFGVMLASLVWDGSYILLGVLGSHTALTRNQVWVAALAALALIYAVTFLVRRWLSRRKARRQSEVEA